TIDVNMDARRFTGPKTVGIRVTVGPEYTSSAEIKVTANSRADIVFNPGQVTFGAVTLGQTATQTIDVEYAGVLNWQVSEVIAKDAPVDVTIKELYRRPGQVGYQLQVTLPTAAPVQTVTFKCQFDNPGAFKRELKIKTDLQDVPVPVVIEGTVAP